MENLTAEGNKISLIERVKAYAQFHNQHNIEIVLEMLTEDIRFETVGVWVKEGKDEIRSLEEFDTVANGSLMFSNFTSRENKVFVRAIENNDWFRISGIDEVRYKNIQFTFRGEQINKIQAEFTPESYKAITEILKSVTGWAERNQPEVLERLMPRGEFKYVTEGGKDWMVLMRKWRDAQSPQAGSI